MKKKLSKTLLKIKITSIYKTHTSNPITKKSNKKNKMRSWKTNNQLKYNKMSFNNKIIMSLKLVISYKNKIKQVSKLMKVKNKMRSILIKMKIKMSKINESNTNSFQKYLLKTIIKKYIYR